ncbi:MAG: hypothetical protein A2007_00995 [Verrucomicrobia bacterium GWC2_42_7]|nr:MAG: hypothetical protein A2007_00995 [Verrucomicrobia bacterium GWC2_42_7]
MSTQVINSVKTYKNVIFDLGAVLVKWDPKELVRHLKREDPSVSDSLLEIPQTEAWKNFDKGFYSIQDVLVALQDTYPRRHVKMFIEGMYKTQLQPLSEGLDLFYAVKSRGYKMFVLSNFSKETFERCYNNYSFLHDLDGAVFSHAIGLAKPDPEIYFYLLENYRLKPEECLFIDDLAVNIQAAKCIGIDGIVCDNHEKVRMVLEQKGVL